MDASRESIVLLQNNNKALPIDKKMKVTLIGPNANATNTMKGNYNVSWLVYVHLVNCLLIITGKCSVSHQSIGRFAETWSECVLCHGM